VVDGSGEDVDALGDFPVIVTDDLGVQDAARRPVAGRENRGFVLIMVIGSIAGSFIGSQRLGVVPTPVLLPLLALILVLSAIKVRRAMSNRPCLLKALRAIPISKVEEITLDTGCVADTYLFP
jgi:hypothetical protein